MTTARERMVAFLAGPTTTNKHLAIALELAISGKSEALGREMSDADRSALRYIETDILREARSRVGERATDLWNAAWFEFRDKWGMPHENGAWTLEQWDKAMDRVPDEDMVPGYWVFLVRALRGEE